MGYDLTRSLIISLFLCTSSDSVLSVIIMKPTFIPYCTTRDRCQPDCSCIAAEDCSLLNMDDKIREALTYYHNQIRDIQARGEPQPSRMTALVYDEQLEEISQCWAARCDDSYSECFLTILYPETSQAVTTVRLEADTEINVFLWIQVINFWLARAKSATAEIINSLPAGDEGEYFHNYAQLLSDNVRALGCAWSKLQLSDDEPERNVTFVCTYGPRGPMQGEGIYETGDICSRCPKMYRCDFEQPFENLCKRIPSEHLPIPPPMPPPLPPEGNAQTFKPNLDVEDNEPTSVVLSSQLTSLTTLKINLPTPPPLPLNIGVDEPTSVLVSLEASQATSSSTKFTFNTKLPYETTRTTQTLSISRIPEQYSPPPIPKMSFHLTVPSPTKLSTTSQSVETTAQELKENIHLKEGQNSFSSIYESFYMRRIFIALYLCIIICI